MLAFKWCKIVATNYRVCSALDIHIENLTERSLRYKYFRGVKINLPESLSRTALSYPNSASFGQRRVKRIFLSYLLVN